MSTTMNVNHIRWVKELYPRLREDDAAVARYRAAVDQLPPIIVARDGVLVDGFHRWQAHKKEGRTQIAVENLGDLTDAEIVEESVRRNAQHGQQLSAADKRRMGAKLWPTKDRKTRLADLAALLSVSERTIRDWSTEWRADEKKEQQAKAWDLWLNCWTQAAIADEIDVDQKTISNWLGKMADLPDFLAPPESRQHFDVWTFQTADGESSYFGKMPPQIMENLLWLYTKPGDIVVDPFAGGGTTIDVAKAMGRRVWASDRKPATPTLPIHEHDILTGWPDGAPSRADLILLDPPYWQQAKGRYSSDPEDLGNMTIGDFYEAWEVTVKTVIERSTRVAYIISPTQRDDGTVVDHAMAMLTPFLDEGWEVERRIIVPYNTQQASRQQVTWARDNKRLLKLYRDLIVMSP